MSKSLLIFLGVICVLILDYIYIFRRWHMRWGAQGDEALRPLPGDEIITDVRDQYTRAIAIQAAPDRLWKWIVQIGQGRGGLYSYEALENLIGCDIPNVNEIRADLQELYPGDKVRLGPKGYPFYTVAEAVQDRYFLLKSTGTTEDLHTWLFLIEPQGPQTSRLIVRSRGAYPPTLGQYVIWRGMTEPLHFIMERKMLLTFREQAEES